VARAFAALNWKMLVALVPALAYQRSFLVFPHCDLQRVQYFERQEKKFVVSAQQVVGPVVGHV
jgi:hypothetical protein